MISAPFSDLGRDFAAGADFGRLHTLLVRTKRTRYEGTHLLENQERIFQMASRLGWDVESFGTVEEGWFTVILRRREA